MKIFEFKSIKELPVNYHLFVERTREHIEDENEYALSKSCPRTMKVKLYKMDMSSCIYPNKPISKMISSET